MSDPAADCVNHWRNVIPKTGHRGLVNEGLGGVQRTEAECITILEEIILNEGELPVFLG